MRHHPIARHRKQCSWIRILVLGLAALVTFHGFVFLTHTGRAAAPRMFRGSVPEEGQAIADAAAGQGGGQGAVLLPVREQEVAAESEGAKQGGGALVGGPDGATQLAGEGGVGQRSPGKAAPAGEPQGPGGASSPGGAEEAPRHDLGHAHAAGISSIAPPPGHLEEQPAMGAGAGQGAAGVSSIAPPPGHLEEQPAMTAGTGTVPPSGHLEEQSAMTAGTGTVPPSRESASAAGGAGPSGVGGVGSVSADEMRTFDVLIVGAGFTGAVLADMYARFSNKRVLVVDSRDHVGGLCHDFVDEAAGILMHKFGPHVFHTSKEHVWRYVNKFQEFLPYEHREVARLKDMLVPLPVNIETVRQLFNVTVNSVEDMQRVLAGQAPAGHAGAGSGGEQAAFREVGEGLQRLAQDLAKKFWDRAPQDLAEGSRGTLKVNPNFDDRYFTDQFQGLPKTSYAKLFQRMLDHPNIVVRLSTDYFSLESQIASARAKGALSKTFFTGSIDAFFKRRGSDLAGLQYRSINFERHQLEDYGVVQPAAVVNYPELQHGPKTSSVEYKYFNRQKSSFSVVIVQTPTDEGEPMYPVPTKENAALYAKYRELADKVEKEEGVHFLGRFAQYQDISMADAIDNALGLYTRLEGRPINKMVTGATAPPTWQARGFVVHFVIALHSEMISWIRDICSNEFFSRPDVRTAWFLYVKKPDRTLLSVEAELYTAMQGTNCSAGEVDVRRLENVGRESHTDLKHMFGSHFAFGDANVFLQGRVHTNLENVVCGLQSMKRQLWDDVGLTRASHPMNLEVDVSLRNRTRAEPAKVLLCRPAPLDRVDPSRLHKLTERHFLPLAPIRNIWFYTFGHLIKMKLRVVYWRYFVKLRFAPLLMFEKSEFIASEASMRRMIAKYRTLLWDQALDQDLSFVDWNMAGYVFEGMWYSLFNDVCCDPATVEFLGVDGRMQNLTLVALRGKHFLAPTFALPSPSQKNVLPVFRRGAVFDTHAPEPRPYKDFPPEIAEASELIMSRAPTLKDTRIPGAVVIMHKPVKGRVMEVPGLQDFAVVREGFDLVPVAGGTIPPK